MRCLRCSLARQPHKTITAAASSSPVMTYFDQRDVVSDEHEADLGGEPQKKSDEQHCHDLYGFHYLLEESSSEKLVAVTFAWLRAKKAADGVVYMYDNRENCVIVCTPRQRWMEPFTDVQLIL